MSYNISNVRLSRVHFKAENNIIYHLEKVQARMNVSYHILDEEKISLTFLSDIVEEDRLLFNLQCEYEFNCDDLSNEKVVIKKAVNMLGDKVEDIIVLLTSQLEITDAS